MRLLFFSTLLLLQTSIFAQIQVGKIGTLSLSISSVVPTDLPFSPSAIDTFDCTADFITQTDSCIVTFSDQSSSSGVITNYYWDFGDGNSSGASYATHSYATAGTYQVTLTIATNTGCIDSVSKSVTVSSCGVPLSCTADFISQTDSCTVTFSDQSSSSGLIMSHLWDFGDGTTGGASYTTHTYSTTGTYTVSLIISTNYGCTDTISRNVTVSACGQPVSCTADFISQTDSCTVTFSDQSSSSGLIMSHFWDFGDGTTGGASYTTHTYSTTGTYTVSLIISTNYGCTDTISKTINITACGQPITCEADFISQSDSCTVTFGSQSYSSGIITSYIWDFGDGSTGGSSYTTHTYSTTGTYTVSLIISTNDGCTDTITRAVNVTACGQPITCDADFISQSDSCTVTFGSQSYSSGIITSYVWDFGDGNTGGASYTTHTYAAAGTYTVSLIISTNDGCTDTISRNVTISECPEPTYCYADFSYFQNSDCEVDFTDMSSTNDSIVSWSWDFGDGHIGGGANPTHIFPQNGTYTVTLIITTTSGCTDTSTQQVILDQCGHDCTADFSYFQNSDCEVDFTDMSTVDDSISSWSWDFGDGHIGGGANPTHIFPQNGTYTVTLIIATTSGCTDTTTQQVILDQCGHDCTADFSYFQNPDCEVDFTDMSTVDDSISSWSWDFGDGHIGVGANPTHIFPQNGTYTVTLIITTTSGCTDTSTQQVILDQCGSSVPCQASFEAMQDSLQPLSYHFRDLSLGTIREWMWEFGDGSQSNEQNPSHTYSQSGPYQVKLTIGTEDGCVSSDSINLNIATQLGTEILSQPVKLYPNPARNTFFVEATFAEPTRVSWELLDLRGKVMQKNRERKPVPAILSQVNIEKLPRGVYIFQLKTDEGVLYWNRVVKR